MTAREAAIVHGAQSAKTMHPRDLAMQALIIRGAGTDRPLAVSAILEARAEWRAYLTVTQRRWQTRISRRHGANLRRARTCTYRASILQGDALEAAIAREALERLKTRETYVGKGKG